MAHRLSNALEMVRVLVVIVLLPPAVAMPRISLRAARASGCASLSKHLRLESHRI